MTGFGGAAAVAACLVAASALVPAASAGHAGASRDPLERLIGTAKEAVGDTLFLRADTYYHGGSTPEEDAAYHEDRVHGAADFISRIGKDVRAHEHSHLGSDLQKEMLPFLSAAVHLDPYNVEAALSTAYWLHRKLGKPEHAERVLLASRAANPRAWEIDRELGQVRRTLGRPHEAAVDLRSSLGKAAGLELEAYELRELHFLLGEALFEAGDVPGARAAYERALGIAGPGKAEGLRKRVEKRLSLI